MEKCAEGGKIQFFQILFFIGFFVILMGILVLMAAAFFSRGDVSFGGFIWIFPFFPFVFGSGPEAVWLILFALILGVLSILIFLFLWRESRKTR
ncbi:MAG: hypothetical protein QXN87_04465 [Candidatus Bathyarchaeia archaeon]